jgi:DNA-directed RNA polymerase delta subunit
MENEHFFYPEGVIAREIGQGILLLNTRTHHYFTVNATGKQMLQLLVRPLSIEEIVTEVAKEYDVSDEQIRKDLSELVTNLKHHGLIVQV